VLIYYNACRATMALTGLMLLLAYQTWLRDFIVPWIVRFVS
jgi:hypothetical protein